MADTKERIVGATAELLRRQGYSGTGLKQISQQSSAPLGSVYHFFPGGKEELAADVLLRSGRSYLALIDAYFDDPPDLVEAVRSFYDGGAELLRQTDYADACPIATVALEVASTNDRLRRVTAQVFDEWIEQGTDRFVQLSALPREEARELVVLLIAGLEGGFLLCRAAKDTAAMETIGKNIAEIVRAALEKGRSRRRKPAARSGRNSPHP